MSILRRGTASRIADKGIDPIDRDELVKAKPIANNKETYMSTKEKELEKDKTCSTEKSEKTCSTDKPATQVEQKKEEKVEKKSSGGCCGGH